MTILKRITSTLYSKKFLLPTNTVTGVVFFGTGDVIVQRFIEKHDFNRQRFAGSYMGFVCHFWYGFLDRMFPGYSRGMVIRKLLGEAMMGPPFGVSMFLIVGTLNSKSIQDIWFDMKDNFKYFVMADWGFYIPLQFFNFQYLQPKFRVLYVSMLSLVYDSFLVYILNRNDTKRAKQAMLEANSKLD